MTQLFVPLHLPAKQAQAFLERELAHREVISVKVLDRSMVIEHEPLPKSTHQIGF